MVSDIVSTCLVLSDNFSKSLFINIFCLFNKAYDILTSNAMLKGCLVCAGHIVVVQ